MIDPRLQPKAKAGCHKGICPCPIAFLTRLSFLTLITFPLIEISSTPHLENHYDHKKTEQTQKILWARVSQFKKWEKIEYHLAKATHASERAMLMY